MIEPKPYKVPIGYNKEKIKSKLNEPKAGSIKDAECQARVEGIFKEIEKHKWGWYENKKIDIISFQFERGEWQAFKDRELKKG